VPIGRNAAQFVHCGRSSDPEELGMVRREIDTSAGKVKPRNSPKPRAYLFMNT